MKRIYLAIKIFLKGRFSLLHEQDDILQIIGSIEKGVEFKGSKVWTLIFAIFIASIGLNVNSTAVIIGAMLISPLMGPIMGAGLGVGIHDFELLKRSLKNLSIAVAISVITSAIYFFVSPLSEAQSELLARTTPTIYDVLIAFFGGLAGIVAGATKDKGNPIPGVAIATALMPPLCTAGYGLATGKILYFIGAFYLFFINAVMISFSTFLMVRFLNFPYKQFVDLKRKKKMQRYIMIVVSVTVAPSIYLGYQIIERSVFKNKALSFVNREMDFEQTQLISKNFYYEQADSNRIEIVLTGKALEAAEIRILRRKLPEYSLKKTKLIIKQGVQNVAKVDVGQIKSGIIEEIYKKNELTLRDKDEKITVLERELTGLKSFQYPVKELGEELKALNPKITAVSANHAFIYNLEKADIDTTVVVIIKAKRRFTSAEKTTLSNWLKKRLDSEALELIFN